MGLGINFWKDEKWRKIHTFLKASVTPVADSESSASPTASQPAIDQTTIVLPDKTTQTELEEIDLTAAPFSPVSIEVSRDGNLWMPGKITRFSGK